MNLFQVSASAERTSRTSSIDSGANIRKTKIYPISQPRQVIINRQTPATSNVMASKTYSTSSSASSASAGAIDADLMELHKKLAENMVLREKQRQEMNELNERLAEYIEKVRYLDAQKQRLVRKWNALSPRRNRETEHVRAIFNCELNNLEELISQTEDEKQKILRDLARLEEDLSNLERACQEAENERRQNQIRKDQLNAHLAELEGELALLKRQSCTFDSIRAANKAEVLRLRNEEIRIKKDLDNENQAKEKALMETQFMKDMLDATESAHMMKWQELATRAYSEAINAGREEWSSEFKVKVKKIREAYEARVHEATEEINETMTLKLRKNYGSVNRGQFEIKMVMTQISNFTNRVAEFKSRIVGLEGQIMQYESRISAMEARLSTYSASTSAEIADLQFQIEEANRDRDEAKEKLREFADRKISAEVELAAYKALLNSDTVSNVIDGTDGAFDITVTSTEMPLRYFSSAADDYVNF